MEDKMYKEFLELQLQWSNNQIAILDEMESKLLEMKEIAEHASAKKLSVSELNSSTLQINNLQQKYQKLAESYQMDTN